MEYFAGLDVSMEQTHICIVDRDGAVVADDKHAFLQRVEDLLEHPALPGKALDEIGEVDGVERIEPAERLELLALPGVAAEEVEHFDNVSFTWIPREENKDADYETRKVLDAG